MTVQINDVPLDPEIKKSQDIWAAGAFARAYAEVQETRRQAYIREADPLFFGWQRGENTEQEWLDAVQVVKDAHPYPEKPEGKK